MRSYPPSTANRRNARARKRGGLLESYPHRSDTEGNYFYHLGGYGSRELWSRVISARRNLKSVPERVYDKIMTVMTYTPEEGEIYNIAQKLRELHLFGGDEEEHVTRTHNLVWWQNGQIVDEYRCLADCGLSHIRSELIPVHTLKVNNNE